ncbi:hypothetical protein B0H10DRAFT_1961445 [Mycena sp. CBHHK59/15]|nr:hypothetical protein B0H10DRAFT_1961445 [Mycena sp. CBHHK59/15]
MVRISAIVLPKPVLTVMVDWAVATVQVLTSSLYIKDRNKKGLAWAGTLGGVCKREECGRGYFQSGPQEGPSTGYSFEQEPGPKTFYPIFFIKMSRGFVGDAVIRAMTIPSQWGQISSVDLLWDTYLLCVHEVIKGIWREATWQILNGLVSPDTVPGEGSEHYGSCSPQNNRNGQMSVAVQHPWVGSRTLTKIDQMIAWVSDVPPQRL